MNHDISWISCNFRSSQTPQQNGKAQVSRAHSDAETAGHALRSDVGYLEVGAHAIAHLDVEATWPTVEGCHVAVQDLELL